MDFRKNFEKVGEYAASLLFVATFVLFAYLILSLLAEMWLLWTGLFFIGVTVAGIGNDNWMMSVGGLALYIASWPLTDALGLVVGLTACGIGLCIWLAAPFVSIPKPTIPRFVLA